LRVGAHTSRRDHQDQSPWVSYIQCPRPEKESGYLWQN
jgi:hypothetical protein